MDGSSVTSGDSPGSCSWAPGTLGCAAGLILILAAAPAAAQEPFNLTAPVKSLATIFTDLFGARGLIVDSLATLPGEQPHSAHFNSDFQFNFKQFGTALVNQFVTVPLPSPASGFTYQFDPSLGVFQRSTQSFGPILAERAETIGARRVSVGFTTQRFTFDTVEGLDLHKVPAVFTHDNAPLLGGREDVVATMNSIEARVTQATVFVTAGISDRVDVSVAAPFVSNYIKVVSDATILRLGTINDLTHFFRQADGSVGNQRTFTAIGGATGLGDITVRVKGRVVSGAALGFSTGVDLRLPTGDAMNLLGTGAVSAQPFAILSGNFAKLSPHVNVGYQWNGSSVLAGNPATGTSGDFADQVTYTAGADVGVSSRVTVSFDLLGRRLLESERLSEVSFHALDGRTTLPNIAFSSQTFSEHNGAVGMKVNLFKGLLLDGNLLFALDDHGVRDKVTPLIGAELTF